MQARLLGTIWKLFLVTKLPSKVNEHVHIKTETSSRQNDRVSLVSVNRKHASMGEAVRDSNVSNEEEGCYVEGKAFLENATSHNTNHTCTGAPRSGGSFKTKKREKTHVLRSSTLHWELDMYSRAEQRERHARALVQHYLIGLVDSTWIGDFVGIGQC
uniref:Uncharacterized protein n=1 Tax=Romanomermis culicivorax TaxID=13658 RepID=A0A915L7A2_ROMCU